MVQNYAKGVSLYTFDYLRSTEACFKNYVLILEIREAFMEIIGLSP